MKVLIVGAGVAGLGIGWRLAQAGVQVTILERSEPASGATFAAAGMLAATAEMAGAPDPEIAFAGQAGRCGPLSPPSWNRPAPYRWAIARTAP